MASCINLRWSHLLRSKSRRKQQQTQDYIYLQWHFMTSSHHHEVTNKSEPEVSERKDPSSPSSSSSSSSSKFNDIHTWLASQPDQYCAEIYCDCCDPDTEAPTDLHYSSVRLPLPLPSSSLVSRPSSSSSLSSSVTSLARRQHSVSSFSSSCTSSSLGEDSLSEESYYSLQIRRTSRSIFKLSNKQL